MSYEGHDQCICKAGHYYERDAYDDARACPCGEIPVWMNPVDDTNFESCGVVPLALLQDRFLASPEKTETCNLGHVHVIERERFRIPSKEETAAMQHYRRGDKLIPCLPMRARGAT